MVCDTFLIGQFTLTFEVTKAVKGVGLVKVTGGNVFEWCLESYDPYPNLNISDEDAFMSSQNKKIMASISRGMRGGCFYNQISSLRSADRNGAKPDDRSNSRGLRLVRSLP